MNKHMRLAFATPVAFVCVAMALIACGKSDPKMLLVGEWRENLQTEKWAENKHRWPDMPTPKERTIHFFADGSGVAKTVYDEPGQTQTESFRWSLSEDGKILKTETPSRVYAGIELGGAQVARIVTLTPKALRIDETSHAHGVFERVK